MCVCVSIETDRHLETEFVLSLAATIVSPTHFQKVDGIQLVASERLICVF